MTSKNDAYRERLKLLFDSAWYLERYPDVAASGIDPLTHYLDRGAAAGYDPHRMFSTSWYLRSNPDVAAVKMNPLVHYIEHGAFERRDPHPFFDSNWYVRQYPDSFSGDVNPLFEHITRGVKEGRSTSPLYPDLASWEIDSKDILKIRDHYDWALGRMGRQIRLGKLGARLRSILIRFGKQRYARSHYAQASNLFKSASFLSPSLRDELFTLRAKCEIRSGRFSEAFSRYSALFYPEPPPPSSPPLTQAPDAIAPRNYESTETPKTIGVVTSFMPKRIEAQQLALRSWRAAGLSVTSVNSAAEIEKLRGYFPDVTFRVVEQPIEILGRSLIPIRALIEAAEELPSDVCGIINSDIVFQGDSSFFKAVLREVPASLVFGSRIDVTQTGITEGLAFRNGYDFFFWERKNSALFKETPMVLGMPWWDFWLPLQANGAGLKIKRFVTSAMVHVIHQVGYDIPAYVNFGRVCAEALAGVYSRKSDDHISAHHAFLYRLFSTAAAIPHHANSDLILTQIGMFCDLSNCSIDALSEPVILQDAEKASGTLEPI